MSSKNRKLGGGASAADGDVAQQGDGAAAKKRKLQLTGAAEEVESALKQAAVGAGDGKDQPQAVEPAEEKDMVEKKDKKEKKEKKDKKEKKEKKQKADGEVDPGAVSDTEYEACDLSACPEELIVRQSGHPKIDGQYKKWGKASRGRPCYFMEKEGKRSVYLFWYRNSKWQISYDLGSHKSLARVEDAKVDGRKLPPCEPHPAAWKVIRPDDKDKDKSKSYVVSAAMRVIDASAVDDSAEKILSNEPDAMPKHRKKGSAPREKPAAAPDDAGGAARAEGGAAAAAAAASAAARGEVFDEEAAAAEAAAGADSDSDDEDEEEVEPASEKASSSDSDSDSDSSQSSSSEKPAPPAPPAPQAKAAPKAAAAPTQGAEQKRETFVSKLRRQLEQIREPKQRQAKLQQVRSMLSDRADHIQKHAGMNAEEMKVFMDGLDRDFGTQVAGAKAGVKPDKGPAPKPTAGSAAPSTPPERRQSANTRKSALKKKDGMRRYITAPRICWPSANSIHLVQVESFRHMGEQLWFQMPGAYVVCDNCDKSVPQSMGALQGEPLKPQFAQSQFLCSDCLQSHNVWGNR